ncbi:hypothetical protein Gohar_010137 [Gossypium harknessii]|uniref:Uncharacterized protein n=1 Tax=Gossypium harknessii TaxID=34285 RepID=A0A7J9GPY4_9ROSI|nr:hypothetical protein [Gossypium harknessii]
MEDVIKYLTQGRGTQNRRLDTDLPTNFNQEITFPIAKIWVQFIGTRIAPMDLPRNEVLCTQPKAEIFFPHLVTEPCQRAEVLMKEIEQFMEPIRSIIRDSLYTQYVELQRK